MSTTTKNQVYTNKNEVRYWVESAGKFFTVVAQVSSFPATEACDDWFADYEKARQFAEQLAQQNDTLADKDFCTKCEKYTTIDDFEGYCDECING